jgi:hypothetical protein
MAALSYPGKGIARRLTSPARAPRLAAWTTRRSLPALGRPTRRPCITWRRKHLAATDSVEKQHHWVAAVPVCERVVARASDPLSRSAIALSEEFRRGSGPARSCAGSASDGLRARAPRRAPAVRGRGTGGWAGAFVEVAASHPRRCSGTDAMGWSRPVPLDEDGSRCGSARSEYRSVFSRQPREYRPQAGRGSSEDWVGGWFVRKIREPAPWPLRL